MKLLVDMNLSPRWVGALARAGFDAVHWSIVGVGDASDADIISYAVASGRLILTHDLDFGAILAASGTNRPSVVQIRADDTNPDRIGAAVIQALRQCAKELVSGALVTVEPGRLRLTLLPLQP